MDAVEDFVNGRFSPHPFLFFPSLLPLSRATRKRLLSNCVHSIDFPGSVPSRPPPSLSYFSSPQHILFLLSPWHSSRQMIRLGMRTWMCWKLAAHETRTANNHRTLLWDFNRSSRRICRSHFVKSRRGRRRMRLRAKERERKSNCWIKRCWWQENGCYSPVGTFRIDGHDASNSPGRR